MGDRAVVVFTDGMDISPGTYLHGHGSQVRELLEAALPRLRHGDPGYSCARFIGVCHERISGVAGNRGLGCYNTPETLEEVRGNNDLFDVDAGVFIVDVNTWEVEAFDGYGFGYVDDGSGECITRLQLDSTKVPTES